MIFKSTEDKIPKEHSSNIVYSVPCKGNECKAVYNFIMGLLYNKYNNFEKVLATKFFTRISYRSI